MKYFKKSFGKFHLAVSSSLLGVALLAQSCLNPKDLIDGTGGLDVQWSPHIALPLVDETTVNAYDLAMRAEQFLPGSLGDMVNVSRGEIRLKYDLDLQEFAMPVALPVFNASVSKEFAAKPAVPAVDVTQSYTLNSLDLLDSDESMPAGGSDSNSELISFASKQIDNIEDVMLAAGKLTVTVGSTLDVDVSKLEFDIINSFGAKVGTTVVTKVGPKIGNTPATSADFVIDLKDQTITKNMTIKIAAGKFELSNKSASSKMVKTSDAISIKMAVSDAAIKSGTFVLQSAFSDETKQEFSLGLGDIEVDKIRLSSGQIDCKVNSPFDILSGPGIEASLWVDNNQIVPASGVWMANNINVKNIAGKTDTVIPLAGGWLKNINNAVNKGDKITARVKYSLAKGTKVKYYSDKDNASFSFSISDIDFSTFEGYLGKMNLPGVKTSVGINTSLATSGPFAAVLQTLIDAGLTSNDKTALSFKISNGSGVPVKAQFTKFQTAGTSGAPVNINFIGDGNVVDGPVTIMPAPGMGMWGTTSIKLANINQLLRPIPSTIETELSLSLNPAGPTQRNFFTKNDKIKMGASIDTRVDLTVKDIAFVGKIDKTLGSTNGITLRKVLEKAKLIGAAQTADDYANMAQELGKFKEITLSLTVTENKFANVNFNGVALVFDPKGKKIRFEPKGTAIKAGETVTMMIPMDVDKLIELLDVKEFQIIMGNVSVSNPNGGGVITFNAQSQAKFKLGVNFKMNL